MFFDNDYLYDSLFAPATNGYYQNIVIRNHTVTLGLANTGPTIWIQHAAVDNILFDNLTVQPLGAEGTPPASSMIGVAASNGTVPTMNRLSIVNSTFQNPGDPGDPADPAHRDYQRRLR